MFKRNMSYEMRISDCSSDLCSSDLVFVQSFLLMISGFIAPVIRRITPHAALLGSLAGISLTFISLSPGAQIFMTPVIGVTCLAVILASWLGSYRYPGGIPGGLMAILAGSLIA